jgi:hypothetical protein
MQADVLHGDPLGNDAVQATIGTMPPVAPEAPLFPVIIDAAIACGPAIFSLRHK